MTDRRWVLPLDDPHATLAVVGGKGASLARLAAAGLPVPAGFHVTTDAYRAVVAAHGLAAPIAAAVAGQDPERAARTIQPLVAAAAVPEDIAAAIRSAYAALGEDVVVAVRSSATAEDLPGSSFAGQQDTFLGRSGADAVVDAVRQCWASLWNARAIAYRQQAGVAHDGVALAVVVQALVRADSAGVLFTADPVTGKRDEVVVNAAWGLGDTVVGGRVSPDVFVVDRHSRRITSRQVGDKAVMAVPTSDGTRDVPVPADRRGVASLTDAQVLELAALGEEVERLQGRPVDIEWATEDGRLRLLQARPITHLSDPLTEVWNDTLAGDFLWTCGNLGEAIPSVMTPATWSLVQIFMSEAMSLPGLGGYRLCGSIGGRFYLNLSIVMAVTSAVGLSWSRTPGHRTGLRPDPRRRRGAADAAGSRGDDPGGPDLRGAVPAPGRPYRRQLPALLAAAPRRAAATRALITGAGTTADLRDLWAREVEPLLRDTSRMLAAGSRSNGAGLVRIRPRLVRLLGPGHDDDVEALLSGLHTDGAHLASLGPLLGLAAVRSGEMDRDTYARTWGHRCPDEFEISVPRPAEDPGWLDAQLATPLPADRDPARLLLRQAEARRVAWRRLVAQHPWRARAVRRALRHAADAARAREAARSEVVRAFGVLRAFVLRAGELTGLGEDSFFLTIEEVLALLDGDRSAVGAVATRRRTYEHYRTLGPYPVLIRGSFDPERWTADRARRDDAADDVVTGFPGAGGVVEGVVRVLTDTDEAQALEPGEILVTTVTNVGWTPLFPRAAAVVTDVGAPLSHAAIVARELGIPAVVGCGNATTALRTGDRVRVDGRAGTVTRLAPAPARTAP